jgi:hypothetical protein
MRDEFEREALAQHRQAANGAHTVSLGSLHFVLRHLQLASAASSVSHLSDMYCKRIPTTGDTAHHFTPYTRNDMIIEVDPSVVRIRSPYQSIPRSKVNQSARELRQ